MLVTCAENFERQGNPWLTERERSEMQAQLAPQRGGRRQAPKRLAWKDRQRIAREYTPEEQAQIKVTENMLAIRQLVKPAVREMVPLAKSECEALVTRVYHPSNTEGNPFDKDWDAEDRRWREFIEEKQRENAARRAGK